MRNFILLAVIFMSCSNGKIDYEKSKNGCLLIPNSLFQNPMQIDTTAVNVTEIMSSGNKALINLYENSKKYEKESEGAYLTNTSNSNIVYFTIRITSNDSFKTNRTIVFKTNPGEKLFIGCNSYVNGDYELIKQTFKIVGERK